MDLGNTAAGDADLESLRGWDRLNDLNLLNTAVTDAGLERLAGLPSLERLTLGGSRLTGPGLARLQRLPLLRSLTVLNADLGDADLAFLQEIKALDFLFLGAQPAVGPKLLRGQGLFLAIPHFLGLRINTLLFSRKVLHFLHHLRHTGAPLRALALFHRFHHLLGSLI